MTIKDFCRAHGGKPGHMIDISDEFGFTSLKTVDGTCFLSFAKTQFKQDMNKEEVMQTLKTKDLDVLEGMTENGNACFTIVNHKDLYEALDF